MMKKVDIKSTRFEHDDFWVDVIETDYGWEAWITKKNYGVSAMMFGLQKEQKEFETTYEEALEIIENNLEEYERGYMEEYGEDTI